EKARRSIWLSKPSIVQHLQAFDQFLQIVKGDLAANQKIGTIRSDANGVEDFHQRRQEFLLLGLAGDKRFENTDAEFALVGIIAGGVLALGIDANLNVDVFLNGDRGVEAI